MDILIESMPCTPEPVQGGDGRIPKEVIHRFPLPTSDLGGKFQCPQVMDNNNKAKLLHDRPKPLLALSCLPENLILLLPPETGSCG